MSLDAATAQELIRKLAEDREAYVQSMNRTHTLLIQAIAAASGAAEPRLTADAVRRTTTSSLDVETLTKASGRTGDEFSDTEDNESLFVQEPLAPESYDEEGFIRHIEEYDWTDAGKACLHGVLDNNRLLGRKGTIFPQTDEEANRDGSSQSHYSIFDVGTDGAPLAVRFASDIPLTRPQTIWRKIKDTNADPNKERQAVGKIVVVREPSPLLFAALHYTMHKHFDVDELMAMLVDDDPALGNPHRAFDLDKRHRSSFVFTFEYFTIMEDGRQPMQWQRADRNGKATSSHIPISRCSSVVALALEGRPSSKVRNKDRRIKEKFGDVYDPFSPWRVLSILCYPDWKSTTETHNSTKHYVNGPEAFCVTMKSEYKDARKRLLAVYEAISDLVEPPPDFIFNSDIRDKLLFEDDKFTYSRRYQWAFYTLGIMNQDIQEMVMSYTEAFKESVWDGTNKIIWPGDASTSSRYAHWRKRMVEIRKDLDHEIEGLEQISVLNQKKMKEVKSLRDNLFSGTSILESRRSIQQSAITVQQGNNIKILTLVTIFFLPLTFVTSVFGMTNMPQKDNFVKFAVATVCICVPTYIFIGSLNTKAGLQFWSRWTQRTLSVSGRLIAAPLHFVHYTPGWAKSYYQPEPEAEKDDADFNAARRRRRSVPNLESLPSRATFNSDAFPLLKPKRTGTLTPTSSTPDRAMSPVSEMLNLKAQRNRVATLQGREKPSSLSYSGSYPNPPRPFPVKPKRESDAAETREPMPPPPPDPDATAGEDEQARPMTDARSVSSSRIMGVFRRHASEVSAQEKDLV